jgi:hypothetical protein
MPFSDWRSCFVLPRCHCYCLQDHDEFPFHRFQTQRGGGSKIEILEPVEVDEKMCPSNLRLRIGGTTVPWQPPATLCWRQGQQDRVSQGACRDLAKSTRRVLLSIRIHRGLSLEPQHWAFLLLLCSLVPCELQVSAWENCVILRWIVPVSYTKCQSFFKKINNFSTVTNKNTSTYFSPFEFYFIFLGEGGFRWYTTIFANLPS